MCALAALVSGEQHPMLTVISEHSVALMAMLRTLAADPEAQYPAEQPDAPQDPGEPQRNGKDRYQDIPIVVDTGPVD